MNTPIGNIRICGDNDVIDIVEFDDTYEYEVEGELTTPVENCLNQLREYFDGTRKEFDLPIKLSGTNFQRLVWENLQKIPFGERVSYGDVAQAIGNPNAQRAVGNANNHNSIVIIVPCHRVIGSDGKLVGYAGGLWRKTWLLEHEAKVLDETLLA